VVRAADPYGRNLDFLDRSLYTCRLYGFQSGDYEECRLLMWRCVDQVRTDVSEERVVSIFRVEKSACLLMIKRKSSDKVHFFNLPNPSSRTGPWGLISL
jgi:hypothetical protein